MDIDNEYLFYILKSTIWEYENEHRVFGSLSVTEHFVEVTKIGASVYVKYDLLLGASYLINLLEEVRSSTQKYKHKLSSKVFHWHCRPIQQKTNFKKD